MLAANWVYADTFTVTNLNDSGVGSLRWAIHQANDHFGEDIIDFSVSGTISPVSALPFITDNRTIIDASSQWSGVWPNGQPGIILDGSIAGDINGLNIYGANSCRVRGIFITGFGKAGIDIRNGSASNTIGGTGQGYRNVISGNHVGIMIYGVETDNNVVSGNYVGTDTAGTSDLGNSTTGVVIVDGAGSNTIGGGVDQDENDEGNIISGNDEYGVYISGTGSDSNIVSGNIIGTDINGTADLGNSLCGVFISCGSQSNVIGGTTEEKRNIISGNDSHGVEMAHSGTDNNRVLGNYIGTDILGDADLGNSQSGIVIRDGAQSNTIGGTNPEERNIISGNDRDGIGIHYWGTDNNTIYGNYIGTNFEGTDPLGNVDYGIEITHGARFNTIGGTEPGMGNIISGNGKSGVRLSYLETSSNVILGNYIGTDVNGTLDLGNSFSGVTISNGASSNTVGGKVEGARNIISGNGLHGVKICNPWTDGNVVSGNYIGVDITSTEELGNALSGVFIGDGAQTNTIGGNIREARNIISGNSDHGVEICHVETRRNTVSGNYIGTNSSGSSAIANGGNGVFIHSEAQSNTIGGSESGARNIISGNTLCGISISGSGTDGNIVSGNYIGTNYTGSNKLGNSLHGVLIESGSDNTIGGAEGAERNIISGNIQHGVAIAGVITEDNLILDNFIGVEVSGKSDLGNGGDGFATFDSVSPIIHRNIIAYNASGVGCYDNSTPDLGGGGQLIRGFNDIHSNVEFDIYNETPNIIMCEYNWWGTPNPQPDQFFGDVDYDPWLVCPSGIALFSNPSEMDILRDFRDNTLSKKETGRLFTETYYKHSPELVHIFLQNPGLATRSAAIIMELMPGIIFLMGNGNGRDMVISRLLVNRIQNLFSKIEPLGSEELVDDLSIFIEMLEEFKGKRISNIWQSLK
jgi:hypothetical protein